MQKRDQPIPGLLYEARVRQGASPPLSQASAPTPSTLATRQDVETGVDSRRMENAAQAQRNHHSDDRHTIDSDRSSSVVADQEAANVIQGIPSDEEKQAIMRRYHERRALELQQQQSNESSHVSQQQQQQVIPIFDQEDDRTIKLGLGDFVFYSLLCARAVLVSFTTFIAVFVVVLFGLALTLVLLAMYRMALPALPISIILGIAFFFATEAAVVPLVTDLSFSITYL